MTTSTTSTAESTEWGLADEGPAITLPQGWADAAKRGAQSAQGAPEPSKRGQHPEGGILRKGRRAKKEGLISTVAPSTTIGTATKIIPEATPAQVIPAAPEVPTVPTVSTVPTIPTAPTAPTVPTVPSTPINETPAAPIAPAVPIVETPTAIAPIVEIAQATSAPVSEEPKPIVPSISASVWGAAPSKGTGSDISIVNPTISVIYRALLDCGLIKGELAGMSVPSRGDARIKSALYDAQYRSPRGIASQPVGCSVNDCWRTTTACIYARIIAIIFELTGRNPTRANIEAIPFHSFRTLYGSLLAECGGVWFGLYPLFENACIHIRTFNHECSSAGGCIISNFRVELARIGHSEYAKYEKMAVEHMCMYRHTAVAGTNMSETAIKVPTQLLIRRPRGHGKKVDKRIQGMPQSMQSMQGMQSAQGAQSAPGSAQDMGDDMIEAFPDLKISALMAAR